MLRGYVAIGTGLLIFDVLVRGKEMNRVLFESRLKYALKGVNPYWADFVLGIAMVIAVFLWPLKIIDLFLK